MAYNLDTDKKIAIISLLCENMSIRGIERATGVHRDTIMRLGVRMGDGCKSILDNLMVNLTGVRYEADEIWGFIRMKQRTAKEKAVEAEYGDVWTWIALDADTKLVPCFAIGDRSAYMADCFIEDLRNRCRNRIQLSTDGLGAYADAVERAFGAEIDYGTVVKVYESPDMEGSRRYSPPRCVEVKKKTVQGAPDAALISTSYVEKQNHTCRMHIRRLSRLTNAFSKKRENFEAAVALHFAYYNLVKTHGTIRCTPAMAAGVVDSHWTVGNLVEMIEG